MSSPVEQWTSARYWSFIRSGLRRMWSKYPPKYKALAEARRRKLHAKGNQKYEYECTSCRKFFAAKNVSVDHIQPAGSLRDYADLPSFVSNLFCSVENLQVLCFRCHKEKTNAERGIIPEIAEFKSDKAEVQKSKLKKLGLAQGSNAAKRVEIFTKHYNKVSS